jgi:hypothetical protein
MMQPLTTRDLLDLWDAGSGRDHTRRALLLLGRSGLAPAGHDPVDLPVGIRDGLLLDLRERLFGASIEAVDRCPACDTRLEIEFDLRDLRAGLPESTPDHVQLTVDGYDITCRPPTSRDLLAIRACRDLADAIDRLLELTVERVIAGGSNVQAQQLPTPVREEIGAALSRADPLAEVRLELECAGCGHQWQAHFDIVGYLWLEIEQLARQALRDVHLLARSYGWSEDAVLRLTPARRRQYLELIVDG